MNPQLEQQILSFVQSAWLHLASLSWEAYLLRGRGAIVIDMRETAADASCTSTYFALDGQIPEILKGYCLAVALLQMAHYDPVRQMTYIVILDEGLISNTTTQEPAPAQCFLSQFPAARPQKTELAILN
jgi:hypothetical protein